MFIFKTLIRDILAGNLNGLHSDNVQVLEGYLEEHQKQLPFEGLPNDTRTLMGRVQTLLGNHAAELNPLASQIREMLKINEPINRRQRFYTFGGFMFGIAGITFGVFTFIYPPTSAPEGGVPKSSAAITAPKVGQEAPTQEKPMVVCAPGVPVALE
ncbi:hypothetical protein H8F21_15830 [Pseudomonas sp. P66]|uniref:Fis family transcriptional regulator n=1 Tax=Pseudomonas arcuscaelestis TaxID=2710591 RepID=A0ABS2C119_9PSED|nr:hypothetical protein [Pseudomonas arcuscaelestis]MBM5459038.1 hypothetical protein [Pseudomonas arcuscaelestis]